MNLPLEARPCYARRTLCQDRRKNAQGRRRSGGRSYENWLLQLEVEPGFFHLGIHGKNETRRTRGHSPGWRNLLGRRGIVSIDPERIGDTSRWWSETAKRCSGNHRTTPIIPSIRGLRPGRGARSCRMPSTHLSLHYHFVFSTKNREPWLAPTARKRVHEYIGGIIRSMSGIAHAVGGTGDHIHIAAGLRATHCLFGTGFRSCEDLCAKSRRASSCEDISGRIPGHAEARDGRA